MRRRPEDPGKALRIYIIVQLTPETHLTHFAYVGLFRNFALENRAITETVMTAVLCLPLKAAPCPEKAVQGANRA